MPNLPTHIELAHKTAERLGHPTLNSNMGCFLLGSTSPDIRIITRGRREDYHFAPLEFDSVGAGVDGLFDSHPDLLSSGTGNGPTQAFVAGYITHLIADEIWIVDLFRPYFGNPDVFEDDVLGKVMDRAFQLELDRQAWQTVDAAVATLEIDTDAVTVGFIAPETLDDWRRWVLSFVERGFSWDRLQFMARRIAAGDEAHPAHLVAQEFVESMPGSLERVYNIVPRDNLARFKERAVGALVRGVGEYLP